MCRRLDRALNTLNRLELDCGIVIKPENIYYFTGYYPTAKAVLILKDDPLLLISKMDYLLAENAGVQYKAVEKIEEELRLRLKGRKIGVEKSHVTLEFYEKHLRGKEVHDMRFIGEMRMRKDREEIRRIKKAAELTKKVIMDVSGDMFGSREREIAARAEYMIKRVAEPAFNAIVASGANSAVPHHSPGDKVIEPDDVVILDFGAKVDHYNADLTRTFPPKDENELYEATLEAQRAAIKECYAGNEIKKADLAARKVLREYGFEELFLHSTGHGVGLEIHEPPRLTKDAKGRFKEGMVVTVEPGVYRDYGIRIEDLVLIRKRPVLLSEG